MDDQYSQTQWQTTESAAPRRPTRGRPPETGPVIVAMALAFFVIAAACLIVAVGLLEDVRAGGETSAWAMAALVGAGSIAGFFSLLTLVIGAVRWAHYGTARPPLIDNVVGHQNLTRAIATMSDRLLISDGAKRIAYREQDRNALREAIREDMRKGDFEAALVLAREMGETYGYREEAEQFRDAILVQRDAETQGKVAEAVSSLDQLVADRQWAKAIQEANKIQRLYPDVPRVQGLVDYVNEAFEQYKHDLERSFLEAAQRDDIETAMELLKELDKYLTEAAAAPLRETARGVIGKKRDNLGVQFRMAVQDHEWTTALRVGEQIVREFPNTKMAQEVRGRLDHLHELAAREQQNAAAAGTAGV